MVYKCTVKYNGVYYPPGMDVPVGGKPIVVEDKKEVPIAKEESVVKAQRGRKKAR